VKGEDHRDKKMQQYRGLMRNVRARFEIIDGLKLSATSEYAELETAAFHLRKSIEGVAFGCLIALENGLREVPRDARGQWNADKILIRISKLDEPPFPKAIHVGDGEDADHHISRNEQDDLSIEAVQQIYRRTHRWLHEMNPYVPVTLKKFDELRSNLLADIVSIWKWLLHHLVVVNSEVLMVVMKNANGEFGVISATANLPEAANIAAQPDRES
jgi:hypothetical protein